MEETVDAEKVAEQKILFFLNILNYIALSDAHSRHSEEQFKKIVEIVKTKPYATVVDYLLNEWEKNKRFLKDVVNCDFSVEDGVPKYSFTNHVLHP